MLPNVVMVFKLNNKRLSCFFLFLQRNQLTAIKRHMEFYLCSESRRIQTCKSAANYLWFKYSNASCGESTIAPP